MQQTKDRAIIALEKGKKGETCSEAIMTAFADVVGIDEKTARKLSSGLAGGVGLSGGTCGALTAACLVLSLKYGPEEITHSYDREQTLGLVHELMERFTVEFGSTRCKELCKGADLLTAKGHRELRASKQPERFIFGTAILLEKIINTHE